MATNDKKVPGVSRRNTFLRMLDAEKVGKVNRIHASTSSPEDRPISRSSVVRARSPESQPTTQFKSSPAASRAEIPALSIEIPPSKLQCTAKDDDIVVEEGEDSDNPDSAASSICQSPGWDDPMGNRRKKEKEEAKKRKKEREKAKSKADAKAEKRHKLIKAAPPPKTSPPSKRVSRLGLFMGRSSSTPVMTQAKHMESLKEESSDRGEVKRQPSTQDIPPIPTPWRTTHGTPIVQSPTDATQISPTQLPSSILSLRQNDGFIGGLKLKLAEEATTQAEAWRQSVTEENRQQSRVPDNYFDYGLENDEKDKREIETSRPRTASDPKSARTPQQWESIYEKAANMMRVTPTEIHDGSSERVGRPPRKKSYPPTSYFPAELDGPYTDHARDSSTASQSRTTMKRNSGDEQSQNRPLSAFSSEQQLLNTRDTSTERGRLSTTSYVKHQRQQSEEGAISRLEDELRVSGSERESSTPRGRQLSVASGKNSRNSSVGVATIKGNSRTSESESTPPRMPTTYKQPQVVRPDSGRKQVTGSSEAGLHSRRLSSGSIPGLKGLRNAARAAFTRSVILNSPSELDTFSAEVKSVIVRQPAVNPFSARTLSNTDVKPNKAERFFGHQLSSEASNGSAEARILCSNQPSPSLSTFSRDRNSSSDDSQTHDRASHSTPNSSESRSIVDESSTITTPIPSTTNSFHEYFTKPQDNDFVTERISSSHSQQNELCMMTSALPPDSPGYPQTTGEDVELSTSRSSSIPRGSQPDKNVKPDELGEKPPLARSMSTPEIPPHDLSFLPVLRHQPLVKPTKDKIDSKGKGKSPVSRDLEETRLGPSKETQVEGASFVRSGTPTPTVPIPSEYLQNARLSMPRPPPRPLSMIGQNGEPMAKMFVVCCSCKYFHDMPSKIYECMARSESVVEDRDLGVSGVVSTSVRCPWCSHGMTTSCCAGYAAVVVLREKLHGS